MARREKMLVKCIELQWIEPNSYPAVVELLRLVGGRVESLTLDPFKPLPGDFFATACTVCPLLKSLHLNHEVDSMDRLLSLANVTGPRCRLERLNLRSDVADIASLGLFFKALSGGGHEISKSLRAFCFGSPWRTLESGTALSTLFDHWLKMLRKNERLEQCVFQCMEE